MPLRGEISSAIPQIQETIGTDSQGRPVILNEQYRRFLETLWERSGGFEDETFANDAQIADLQSAIATAGERLESLEQLIQQDRSIDAAIDDLQSRLAAIESLPTIQENADVSGQIDAIQFGLRSLEEQVFTASRGIDVVTNEDIVNNANISPDKLKTITGATEVYQNETFGTTETQIMKLQVGATLRTNQWYLDGSRVTLEASDRDPSILPNLAANNTGTINWYMKIHENGEEGTFADGTTVDSGVIDVILDGGNYIVDSAGNGNVSVWTPSSDFYTWRSGTVTYPTSSSWIVLWMKIGSGSATSANVGIAGVTCRIDFTSAFGFSES